MLLGELPGCLLGEDLRDSVPYLRELIAKRSNTL